MIMETKLPHYIHKIKALREITRSTLLTNDFLMNTEANLSMYYAPHNEYVNTEAHIVLVGLTPGWNQMQTAYTQLLNSLKEEKQIEKLLQDAKLTARFSGSMRHNLISMLNELELTKVLPISSTEELFSTNHTLLHTTSIIKYPVFYNGANYTGYRPTIHQSNLLKTYAYQKFPEELKQLKNKTLIIPLGKAVENALYQLPESKHMFIHGFPHPSGANGHRVKQFKQNKADLIEQIHHWHTS